LPALNGRDVVARGGLPVGESHVVEDDKADDRDPNKKAERGYEASLLEYLPEGNDKYREND
jgi:hypothetical protein